MQKTLEHYFLPQRVLLMDKPPSLMEAKQRHKYLQKQKRQIHSIMYMNKNAKISEIVFLFVSH